MNENRKPETRDSSPDLVEVRQHGTVMKLDLAALVTLIQQRAVDARTEVRGKRLTGGAWRRLGELDVYRTLGSQKSGVRSQNGLATNAEANLPPLERAEKNLARYFDSLAAAQLRRDALVSVIAAGATAGLSVPVHRYVLILFFRALGWGVGYLFAAQVLFPGWIRRLRTSGFRRLPWSSRVLLLASIALPGYFLIASLLPELPGETLFRWIDGTVSFLFAAASATIWAFRIETGRMKRVFELSTGIEPKQVDESDER
jgi:hypothetical protein